MMNWKKLACHARHSSLIAHHLSFHVHRSITRISGFSITDCPACPPYFDDRSEETAQTNSMEPQWVVILTPCGPLLRAAPVLSARIFASASWQKVTKSSA